MACLRYLVIFLYSDLNFVYWNYSRTNYIEILKQSTVKFYQLLSTQILMKRYFLLFYQHGTYVFILSYFFLFSFLYWFCRFLFSLSFSLFKTCSSSVDHKAQSLSPYVFLHTWVQRARVLYIQHVNMASFLHVWEKSKTQRVISALFFFLFTPEGCFEMGNYKFRLSDMMPNSWFFKSK